MIYITVVLLAVMVIMVWHWIKTDRHNKRIFAKKEAELAYEKTTREFLLKRNGKLEVDVACYSLDNKNLSNTLFHYRNKTYKQSLKLKKAGTIVTQLLHKLKGHSAMNEIVNMTLKAVESALKDQDEQIKKLTAENADLKKTQAFASAGAKAVRKNRKTYPKKKLTEQQIGEIKKLYPAYSQATLAKEYGVSHQMISRIVKRK